MESTVSIDQFQEELQSWKHELSSSKQQIRHFESQLEFMSAQRLPKDLLAQVEHFQNNFICQKEVIDKLRHDLPDSRHKVEHIFNSSGNTASSEDGMDMHEMLGERMDTFRKLFDDLKDEFRRFESEWL
jgi:hypothetical protein